jgi:(2Fe-2S) ferredoxin
LEDNSVAIDPKGREDPGYDRHMFICGHERPLNGSRPSCKNRGSLELLPRIKQAVREEGLTSIRVQKSGCLDFCENGIACVIYPEGTWYQLSNKMDITSIIQHLKDGTVSTVNLMKLESE